MTGFQRIKVRVTKYATDYTVSLVGGDEDAQDIRYPRDVNPEFDAAMASSDQQDFYAQLWLGDPVYVNIDTKTLVT